MERHYCPLHSRNNPRFPANFKNDEISHESLSHQAVVADPPHAVHFEHPGLSLGALYPGDVIDIMASRMGSAGGEVDREALERNWD